MKILLDENLPKKLKYRFSKNHQVFTVSEMSWNSKKNGELLKLLEINDFEVVITSDKNLEFQQNLQKFNIMVIVINARDNRYETVLPFVSKVEKRLTENNIGNIIRI